MSDLPVTTDSGETPSGTADASMVTDLTAAPEAAAADVPPELLASRWDSTSGPGGSGSAVATAVSCRVVLAIVVVAVSFQVANSQFLSALNLVNLFEQSTVYMVLAMAEIFALLLGRDRPLRGPRHGAGRRRGRRACAAGRRELAVVGWRS